MSGELPEEIDNFRKEILDGMEANAVQEAMQKGNMDFADPQNMLELLQQIINPSQEWLKSHPAISRDFGTSNLPNQSYVWLIHKKLETAMFKRNIGLSDKDEMGSIFAILMLMKSLGGWQVRELRTNSVRVDNPVQKKTGWFRR